MILQLYIYNNKYTSVLYTSSAYVETIIRVESYFKGKKKKRFFGRMTTRLLATIYITLL